MGKLEKLQNKVQEALINNVLYDGDYKRSIQFIQDRAFIALIELLRSIIFMEEAKDEESRIDTFDELVEALVITEDYIEQLNYGEIDEY